MGATICILIWKIKLIDILENVQSRATKSVPELSSLTCEESLRKIDFRTLAYRRIRGDMIETYKILTGKYNPEVSNFNYEKIHIQEVINIKSSKIDPDWMSESIRSVWEQWIRGIVYQQMLWKQRRSEHSRED